MSLYYPLLFAILGVISGASINLIANELIYSRGLFREDIQGQRRAIGVARFNWSIALRTGSHPGLTIRTWVVLLLYGAVCPLFFAGRLGEGQAWAGWLLLGYLGIVAINDLEHKVILFPVVGAGAVLGFAYGALLHGFWNTLFGGIVGFGIMYLFYWMGRLFVLWIANRRGVSVNEVALGFGDVNLAGIVGLCLGWPGVLAGLYLAILLGGIGSLAIIVVMTMRREYSSNLAIPYGPFLVLAACWFLFFRPYFM